MNNENEFWSFSAFNGQKTFKYYTENSSIKKILKISWYRVGASNQMTAIKLYVGT